MLQQKPIVNKTSKSLLAKCMASEDIRVEHSKSAETAAFDIKNRCLILPVWKDMSNSMYDMLVAHEVSHALHTPFEEWDKALDGVKNVNAFKQICNVVEDARIERLIKTQYAGVRKDFARAYGELHASDLFELKGKNIAEMGLIDRLNIEFKLGLFGLIQVPFSADEKQYVTRMANTETFADVVELAKELLEDWKADQEENQDNQDGQSEQGSDDGSSDDGSQSQSSDGDQDGDQDGSSSSDGQDGDQDGSDTSESTDGAGDDAETQSGSEGDSPMSQPNLDDIQGNQDEDGKNQDAQSEDGADGTETSSMEYDDYSNNGGGLPSDTQSAFDQGMKDLVDDNAKGLEYNTLPTSMNLDNIILDYKDVFGIFEAFGKNQSEYNDYRAESFERALNEIAEKTDKFISSKKAVVNHMVSQFQMKQSADADRRTSIAKSGVLDTTAMMSYRWSEDVFQSNEVIADGKNHGMVFFLDWSGSMSNILQDTIEQLLILTEFCNKVNIPFEVYAFSDRTDVLPEECYSQWDDAGENRTCPQYNVKEGASGQLKPHDFSLINFVSSRMNKKEYKEAIRNLYGITINRYNTPCEFHLGCTPLNEAVVTAMDIVPAFQEATDVQIVNAVFLTDGQGHGMGLSSRYNLKPMLHDPVTKKDYDATHVGWSTETNLYLEVLKDRTGCNIVGIFLYDGRNIQNRRHQYLEDDDIATATKTWKTSNYAVASDSKTSYDECYIIKGNIGNDEDAMDNLGDDVSYTKLRNAFKKSANGNKTNKIIATKMIEVFASTLVK